MSVKLDLDEMGKTAELTPPDFKTYSNYIGFLKKKSDRLQITESFNLKKCEAPPKNLERKVRLIKTFKKTLDREFNDISKFSELAELNNVWIAIKSYYLIFHLWCIVNYLVSLDEKSINSSHSAVNRFIKAKVKEGTILFSNPQFNKIQTYSQIEALHCSAGAQLKDNYDQQEMESFIFKKIASAKLNDYKRSEEIKDWKKKKDKELRDEYKKKEEIMLVEFFYLHRIKTNYREVEFLEKKIDQDNHFIYYLNYYALTCNFYEALKKLIISLSKKRYNPLPDFLKDF